jgi:hypothetical protein
MPVVVCDSSTLIHLARINRITFLKDFYGKIVVAPAVWKEVVDEGQGSGFLSVSFGYPNPKNSGPRSEDSGSAAICHPLEPVVN